MNPELCLYRFFMILSGNKIHQTREEVYQQKHLIYSRGHHILPKQYLPPTIHPRDKQLQYQNKPHSLSVKLPPKLPNQYHQSRSSLPLHYPGQTTPHQHNHLTPTRMTPKTKRPRSTKSKYHRPRSRDLSPKLFQCDYLKK